MIRLDLLSTNYRSYNSFICHQVTHIRIHEKQFRTDKSFHYKLSLGKVSSCVATLDQFFQWTSFRTGKLSSVNNLQALNFIYSKIINLQNAKYFNYGYTVNEFRNLYL